MHKHGDRWCGNPGTPGPQEPMPKPQETAQGAAGATLADAQPEMVPEDAPKPPRKRGTRRKTSATPSAPKLGTEGDTHR